MEYNPNTVAEQFMEFLSRNQALKSFVKYLSEYQNNDLNRIYPFVNKYIDQPELLIFKSFPWSVTNEDRDYWEELHCKWQTEWYEMISGDTKQFKSIW